MAVYRPTYTDAKADFLDRIEVAVDNTTITLSWDDRSGELKVAGRQDLACFAERQAHDNQLACCRSFGCRWRAAREIAHLISGEIASKDEIVAALRSGWIRLLKQVMIRDPAGPLQGRTAALFASGENAVRVIVQVRPHGRRQPYFCSRCRIDDMKVLEVSFLQGNTTETQREVRRKVKWEDIESLECVYRVPLMGAAIDRQRQLLREHDRAMATRT